MRDQQTSTAIAERTAPTAVRSSELLGELDLRLTDCMAMMREMPDNAYDLAIVDPPYGIGVNSMNMGSRKTVRPDKRNWDDEIPTPEYFAELRRVSKNQIVWGANHYIARMPLNSPCWIVWDKRLSNEVSFAAVELAWTSFRTTAKKFECHPMQLDRFHPTQKPVKLYEWLLANYAEKGQRILDTHMGSGSIAIACYNLGYALTASEIDKEYYDKAIERIKRATQQQRLLT